MRKVKTVKDFELCKAECQNEKVWICCRLPFQGSSGSSVFKSWSQAVFVLAMKGKKNKKTIVLKVPQASISQMPSFVQVFFFRKGKFVLVNGCLLVIFF